MKKIVFIISILLLGNASFGQHTYKQSLVEGVLEMVFMNNDMPCTISGAVKFTRVH